VDCTQAGETRLLSPTPEPHSLFHKNASPESVDYFRLLFAYTGLMSPPLQSQRLVVVQCKGCHENIPAPVESMPAQPIAAKCPLCHEHRRYLPSEVFLGPLSHRMIRKPVRTADGRVG
jgi:hypothetical protein